MNIRQLDLNLLLVFDAIYRERNIGAAAKKLGLSQPAVSNALKRLRDFTGDTLFFRSGSAMMPTRAANSLAVPIGHALSTVEESMSAVRSFDPATSTRTFRIGINDTFRFLLGPALITLAEREAPNIVLEFVAQTMSPPQLMAAIRAGDIDTGLMPRAVIEDGMSYEVASTDQLAFVVRRGHHALGRPVTKEVMQNLRYLVVSQNNAMRLMVDEQFRKAGIIRKIICETPDHNVIAAMVEASDAVAVLGVALARQHMRDHSLSILDTPIKLPRIEAALVWSKTSDDDQGHLWLRTRILQIIKTAMSINA